MVRWGRVGQTFCRWLGNPTPHIKLVNWSAVRSVPVYTEDMCMERKLIPNWELPNFVCNCSEPHTTSNPPAQLSWIHNTQGLAATYLASWASCYPALFLSVPAAARSFPHNRDPLEPATTSLQHTHTLFHEVHVATYPRQGPGLTVFESALP